MHIVHCSKHRKKQKIFLLTYENMYVFRSLNINGYLLAIALKYRFVFVHNSKYLICLLVLLCFSLYTFILFFMKRCCFGYKMNLDEFLLVCWLPIER